MKLNILLCALFLTAGFTGFSQTDEGKKNNSTITKVEDGIYIYQSRGGNIGLSYGPDGTFMIDAQFADAVPDLIDDVNRIRKAPIRFLINTHHHGDHTGGNAELAKTGTTIISHENVRNRLIQIRSEKAKAGDKIDERVLPIITFKDDLTFFFNGEAIQIIHIKNAHTDGDAVIYFTKSNVLHVGDLYFHKRYPYIDLENGGDVQGYVAALSEIIKIGNKDTKIIPGHGDIANKDDIKAAISMFKIFISKVSHQVKLKKTEDEVAAMTDITANFDARGFGDHFITNEFLLRTIYKSAYKNIHEQMKEREKALKDMDGYQQKLKEQKEKDGKN